MLFLYIKRCGIKYDLKKLLIGVQLSNTLARMSIHRENKTYKRNLKCSTLFYFLFLAIHLQATTTRMW